MDWAEWGIQSLGFIAMVVSFCGYQAKTRKRILIFQIVSCMFWTVHFLLLGGMTGAVMNICAMVRASLYLMKGKVRFFSTVWCPVVFSLGFLAFGFLLNEGWLGFLPVLSLILSSIALFLSDEQHIRVTSFFCSPPFLIYDWMKSSYAGVAAEVVNMVSIVIGYIRYSRK